MKRALVFGSADNVGREVVTQLPQKNTDVRAFTRRHTRENVSYNYAIVGSGPV
jgi:nucleoside-diphosphate-sugar epimerase